MQVLLFTTSSVSFLRILHRYLSHSFFTHTNLSHACLSDQKSHKQKDTGLHLVSCVVGARVRSGDGDKTQLEARMWIFYCTKGVRAGSLRRRNEGSGRSATMYHERE